MSWAEAYEALAELKKVQTQADGVRLSERNCIELVSKLIEKRMVDLVYSQDGKEYITREHLYFEVEQEIEYANGRTSLVKLCEALNVCVENIEPVVLNVVKKDKNLYFINSDIIHRTYLDSLAVQINQKLKQSGIITFIDLSAEHDLPLTFIHERISPYFGSVINGSYAPDKKSIMSPEHQNFLKNKLIDEFKASSKPVSLKAISSATQIPESFLLLTVEELLKSNVLDGKIPGTIELNSMYIPNVFVNYQKDSVRQMMDSTQIVKYSQLSKLGVSDPKRFIALNCTDKKLTFLQDCCVSEELIFQVTSSVEQTISESSWLDLSFSLPSQLTNDDILQLYELSMKANEGFKKDIFILCETVICTNKFVEQCEKLFHDQVKEKARLDLKEKYQMVEKMLTASASSAGPNSKKEERKQKALGKAKGGNASSGKSAVGGRGGREAKTKKAVKNKFRDRGELNDNSDSEAETQDQPKSSGDALFKEVLQVSDIEHLLEGKFTDDCVPETFCVKLAELIFDPLKQLYQMQLKEEFEKNHEKKVSTSDMQSCVTSFAQSYHLTSKALAEFENTSHYSQIQQHVLKTQCNEVVNNLVNLILDEYGCSVNDPSKLTPEARVKLLCNVKNEAHRNSLETICKKHENFDEFTESLLNCCSSCDVFVGKTDKKREKTFLTESCKNAELAIEESIKLEDLVLNTCSYLFQKHFRYPIVLPGKFVSAFLEVLKPKIDAQLLEKLELAQKQIADCVAESKTNSSLSEESIAKNEEMLNELKTLVLKPSNTSASNE